MAGPQFHQVFRGTAANETPSRTNDGTTSTPSSTANSPPRKRQRFDFNDTITICVGPSLKEFMVHKNVITKSSKFICAALSKNWKEARDKRIKLADVEVPIFEGYLHWLYNERILPAAADTIHCTGLEMVKLYLLGDYLNDSLFCATLIDKLVERRYETNFCPKGQTISVVWEQTTEHSPLRKVLKELAMTWNVARVIEVFKNGPEYPREFVFDVLSRMTEVHTHTMQRTISCKTCAEVEQICRGFFAPVESQHAPAGTK